MHFRGVVPEDAPDPAQKQWARIAGMPFAVYGLVPQATLEEAGPSASSSGSSDGGGFREMSVSLTYTLIRHPDHRADPANLADLDDETREALNIVPPWPRPQWIIDAAERLRFPMLWEAARTGWYPDADARPPLDDVLVDHMNHVLRNQFRAERGLDGRMGSISPAPDVTRNSIQRDVVLRVDGADRAAAQIDTDPHVFAIGTAIDDATLLTLVVSRDELPYIRLEAAARPLSPNAADGRD